MGSPCGLTSHGRYAAKHDPFVYFNDVNGWDGTAFHPSPAATLTTSSTTPSSTPTSPTTRCPTTCSSRRPRSRTHDGSTRRRRRLASREIPKLLASDAFQRGGVVFLLWDEGGGTPAADDPPFLAISPHVRAGLVSQADTTPARTSRRCSRCSGSTRCRATRCVVGRYHGRAVLRPAGRPGQQDRRVSPAMRAVSIAAALACAAIAGPGLLEAADPRAARCPRVLRAIAVAAGRPGLRGLPRGEHRVPRSRERSLDVDGRGRRPVRRAQCPERDVRAVRPAAAPRRRDARLDRRGCSGTAARARWSSRPGCRCSTRWR